MVGSALRIFYDLRGTFRPLPWKPLPHRDARDRSRILLQRRTRNLGLCPSAFGCSSRGSNIVCRVGHQRHTLPAWGRSNAAPAEGANCSDGIQYQSYSCDAERLKMREIIDISAALTSGIASDPPGHRPEITYIDHHQSAEDVIAFFPGATVKDLPDSEGWAIEKISATTHTGTHVDAPYHYASTMNEGKRAITIDEVPLDWCFQNGAKLDFRGFDDGYVVTPEDIDAELERIG